MSKGGWIDLDGRVAAVTGAASGLGRASAFGLAEVGATVLALDRDEAGAKLVAEQIVEAGGQASWHALDVTCEADWQAVEDWISQGWGHLDIMVNSAGIATTDRVGDADIETYRRTFAVNVEGSLLGMKTALAFMRRQGKGAIVNLASAASYSAAPIMAAYGASKAAIGHYTRSAAVESLRAGHDIRINSVHPGLTQTAMADDFYGIYSFVGSPDEIVSKMTTGRAGRAEEVADLVVYLSSDRASFISGASIAIDRAQSA